jgi:hypothetical protein
MERHKVNGYSRQDVSKVHNLQTYLEFKITSAVIKACANNWIDDAITYYVAPPCTRCILKNSVQQWPGSSSIFRFHNTKKQSQMQQYYFKQMNCFKQVP